MKHEWILIKCVRHKLLTAAAEWKIFFTNLILVPVIYQSHTCCSHLGKNFQEEVLHHKITKSKALQISSKLSQHFSLSWLFTLMLGKPLLYACTNLDIHRWNIYSEDFSGEEQKELLCVFVDPDKVHDRAAR